MIRILIIALSLISIVAAGWWALRNRAEPSPAGPRRIASASFLCNGGKSLDATFYAARSGQRAASGGPPSPGGSARVMLSDGRRFDLAQTLSADGARYATPSGAFVFWSKGNGAFVLEHGRRTYAGCVEVAPDPGALPEVYENGRIGFSIRYPAGYSVDSDYRFRALGPGRSIKGVKFTISPSLASGTNLSADSYLSVEWIPKAPSCTAERFLPAGAGTQVTRNGRRFSVARSTDAGAGNRYENIVYALRGTHPCLALRYLIHYTVLENYPRGAVRQFDRAALVARFDAMRGTLTVQQ